MPEQPNHSKHPDIPRLHPSRLFSAPTRLLGLESSITLQKLQQGPVGLNFLASAGEAIFKRGGVVTPF